MLGFLRIFSKRHRAARASGDRILRAVLDQARAPVFYERGGVADTVTGRFDLIAVHAFLVLRALRHEAELKDVSQAFLDGLFSTIDSSYREAGVADPGVPRKMKQAAEAFYGRLGAYEKGLSEGGLAGLEDALARNLYRGEDSGPGRESAMAHYVIGSLGTLAMLSEADWRKGKLRFAVPAFGDGR
jgi:cytochrome b pre-mRNA-processing protein 3